MIMQEEESNLYAHIFIYTRRRRRQKCAFLTTHSHFSSLKYTHFREGVQSIYAHMIIILIRVVDFLCVFYVYVCVFFYYIQPSDLSLFYSRRRRPSFFSSLLSIVYMYESTYFYFHNAHFYIHYNMFGSDSTLSLLLCVRVDFLFLISHFVAVVVV